MISLLGSKGSSGGVKLLTNAIIQQLGSRSFCISNNHQHQHQSNIVTSRTSNINNNIYYGSNRFYSKSTKKVEEKEVDYESFSNDPYDPIVDEDFLEFEEEMELNQGQDNKAVQGLARNRVLAETMEGRFEDGLDAVSSKHPLKLKSQYEKLFSQQLNKRRDTHHTDNISHFDVRAPLTPPSHDESINKTNMGEWEERDFDEHEDEEEVDLDQEDDAADVDSDNFTPFIPARPIQRTVNTFNGVAHGYSKRKDARATAYLKLGSGELSINGRTLIEYFGNCIAYKDTVIRPLVISETLMKWDIDIRVSGGGMKGQAEAIMRALALAISNYDLGYRMALRFSGVLKHDIRRVERKKPGQLKARKKFPLVKR